IWCIAARENSRGGCAGVWLDRQVLGAERRPSACRESIAGIPLVHRRRYRTRAGHVAPPCFPRGERFARPRFIDGASSNEDVSGAPVDSAVSVFFSDALSAALDRRPER